MFCFFFSPVKFSAGGSVVKSKKPLEFRETWILVAGLRLTHWMTLGNPCFFLDLDFLNSSRKWLQKIISQSPGSSGILWPKDRLSASPSRAPATAGSPPREVWTTVESAAEALASRFGDSSHIGTCSHTCQTGWGGQRRQHEEHPSSGRGAHNAPQLPPGSRGD